MKPRKLFGTSVARGFFEMMEQKSEKRREQKKKSNKSHGRSRLDWTGLSRDEVNQIPTLKVDRGSGALAY